MHFLNKEFKNKWYLDTLQVKELLVKSFYQNHQNTLEAVKRISTYEADTKNWGTNVSICPTKDNKEI